MMEIVPPSLDPIAIGRLVGTAELVSVLLSKDPDYEDMAAVLDRALAPLVRPLVNVTVTHE